MNPITRKEYFLAKMGGQNVEIPTPITREESFLAYLCGENIEVPKPFTVEEMYLAAMCGVVPELPYPFTRLQRIQKDLIETGSTSEVPVTREEYFWTQIDLHDIMFTTVSGSLVTFTVKHPAPVEALTAAITPVQDLHGQTSPYPAGGGKNKLKSASAPDTKNGVSMTVNADGSLKFSGTATALTIFVLDNALILPSGSYIVNGVTGGSDGTYFMYVSGGVQTAVKNFSGDTSFESTGSAITVAFYVRSGATVNTTVFPMIRLSSVADATYAPYSNICPITGWSEAAVTRTGKNLFDGSFHSVVATTDGSKWWLIDYGNAATAYIPIVGGMKYTLSRVGGNRFGVFETAETPQVGNTHLLTSLFNTSSANQATVTASASAKYLVAVLSNDTVNSPVTSLQCEVGETATAYEAYTAQTVTIDLSGTRYGGTLDVLTGVLTVTEAGVTYNGSEDGWTWYGALNQASITLPSSAKYINSNVTYICNALTPCPNTQRDYHIGNYASLVSSGAAAAFSAPNCDTLAKFKTWAGTTNIQFVYQLATPLSVQLTPAQLETLLGQNNIWANCGDVAVTYRSN